MGATQGAAGPPSPRYPGCCSGSGGSRCRRHSCTGGPWKKRGVSMVARTWCTIFPKGPSKDVGAVAGERAETGIPLSPPRPTLPHPPPPPATSRPGQAGPSPGSRNWKGKLCSPVGRLPAETGGRVRERGSQEPEVAPQHPGRSRHCSQLAHTASGFWGSQPPYPAPQQHRVMAGAKDGGQELGLNNGSQGCSRGGSPPTPRRSWPLQPPIPYQTKPSICQGEKSTRVHSTGKGWSCPGVPESGGPRGRPRRRGRQTGSQTDLPLSASDRVLLK